MVQNELRKCFDISLWSEKNAQGIIFIFTYSRLGWSLRNNAIEIGVRHFFSTVQRRGAMITIDLLV